MKMRIDRKFRNTRVFIGHSFQPQRKISRFGGQIGEKLRECRKILFSDHARTCHDHDSTAGFQVVVASSVLHTPKVLFLG